MKGREFDQIFRTGFRLQGELVRLLCLQKALPPSPSAPPPSEREASSFGVAVGKKQCNACGRSRGKRVLREAMRRIMPFLVSDMSVVAMLKNEALDAKANAVYVDAARALDKRGLLTEKWRNLPSF